MRTLFLVLSALLAPVPACDVATGTVPTDFPLPVPDGAVLSGAVDLRVAGIRTTTVQVVPPDDLSDETLLDACADAMVEAGVTEVARTDGPAGKGVAGHSGDGRAMTATLGHERGTRVLTLVAVGR